MADVFLEDAGWREHLVFDWDYRCLEGVDCVRRYLRDHAMTAVPLEHSLEVSMGPGSPPHVLGVFERGPSKLGLTLPAPTMANAPFTKTPEVTAHFRFQVESRDEMNCGTVVAIVRLRQEGRWRAKTFFTTWDPHAMRGKLALARPFLLSQMSEQERQDWIEQCQTKPEVVIGEFVNRTGGHNF